MDELLDTLRALSHFDARLDAYLACHDVDHFPLEQILKTLLSDLVAQRMTLEAKNFAADIVMKGMATQIIVLQSQLAKALIVPPGVYLHGPTKKGDAVVSVTIDEVPPRDYLRLAPSDN